MTRSQLINDTFETEVVKMQVEHQHTVGELTILGQYRMPNGEQMFSNLRLYDWFAWTPNMLEQGEKLFSSCLGRIYVRRLRNV